MKKIYFSLSVSVVLLTLGVVSHPAMAQMGGTAAVPKEPVIAPLKPGVVVAPKVAAPVTKAGPPPVNVCTKGDVRGIWKLMQVFETPKGNWMADFNANPQQFVWFAVARNNSYYETKGQQKYASLKEAREQLLVSGGQIPQQFVVGDKGALYFYKNGKSDRSMYCGIVQEKRPPYNKGDMVLTPTQASGSQIFLLYRHPRLPKNPPNADAEQDQKPAKKLRPVRMP